VLHVAKMVHGLNLFRPSIVFSPRRDTTLPKIEAWALSCVRNAIANTNTLGQTCVELACQNAMLEVWLWQWSAALSLVGYILAYPRCPFTPSVRYSVGSTTSVLNSHSKHDAAKSIQKLVVKAYSLVLLPHAPARVKAQIPYQSKHTHGFPRHQ
jgi:hypothetical protein